MDRLQSMMVYVAVAEEQGFAAAARKLQMSPPAVTRAISALEERIGVRLLNRTTRRVQPTEAGLRYLDDARRLIAEIDEADEAAAGINAEPRGRLVITAPVLFGRKYVMAGVVDYMQRYPETWVTAMYLDRVVNLMDEGLDVAIRISELPDSSLRALRVGGVKSITCASPEYLKEHGEPKRPEELRQHCIIQPTSSSLTTYWRYSDSATGPGLGLQPRLTVTSVDGAIEAAKLGLGITRVLSYQIADELQTGKLVRILEPYEPAPRPISIVHRESRFASAKVRSFIDLMAERLRSEPALNWKS